MGEGAARRSRRRGKVLESAILDAAWLELTQAGWAGFSMDSVARRAGAGKASLYKRWPDRVDLALAVARDQAARSEFEATPGSDVRSDLLAILKRTADFVAGPFGEVVRGLVADVRPGGVSVADRFGVDETAVGMVADALAAAGLPDARRVVPPSVLSVGLGMVVYDYLLTGRRPKDARLAEVLDRIWLPALAPYGLGGASEDRSDVMQAGSPSRPQ